MYKLKYLKYKKKYFNLLQKIGGSNSTKKKKSVENKFYISTVWITILSVSKLLEGTKWSKGLKLNYSPSSSGGSQVRSCGVAQNIVLDVLKSKYDDNSQKIELTCLKLFCKYSEKDRIFAINYENFDHVTTLYYHNKSKTYSFFQSFTFFEKGKHYNDTGYFLHNYYSEEHIFNNQLLKKKNSFFINIDIFIQLMETNDNLKYLSKMLNVTFPLPSKFSIILCKTNADQESMLETFHEIQERKKQSFKGRSFRERYDEVMKYYKNIYINNI